VDTFEDVDEGGVVIAELGRRDTECCVSHLPGASGAPQLVDGFDEILQGRDIRGMAS